MGCIENRDKDIGQEPLSVITDTDVEVGSVKKVPAEKLGISEPDPLYFGNPPNDSGNPVWTHSNWLKSRYHFNFAEYFNSKNTNFGVLQVMNDELVQPVRGFVTRGQCNAEICTYVVEGRLTHQYSMMTNEILAAGALQLVTAGSGVRHSEHNDDATKPLRFIQMWLTPRTHGLEPRYLSCPGDQAARTNRWHLLVSDISSSRLKSPVSINADANIFVTELDERHALPLIIESGRQAYMLCIDGATCVTDEHDGKICPKSGVNLVRYDAAEIVGPAILEVTGPSHILVVEMQHNPRNDGRGDL